MKTSNLGSPICDVLSCLVMSNSLGPRGLQPIRLLCPWRFSRQEYWSVFPCPPAGNLPNLGIIAVNSLLSVPPGKPWPLFSHGKGELPGKRGNTEK